MTSVLPIDMVSDVVCPWCFIGKRQLDAARLYVTATRLDDGAVLLLGGYDSGIVPTARAWMYWP